MIFLTVQKSKAAIITTIMKVKISSPIKALRNKKEKIDAPLKAIWKRQATGLIAVEKRVSTSPSSCKCLKSSLD